MPLVSVLFPADNPGNGGAWFLMMVASISVVFFSRRDGIFGLRVGTPCSVIVAKPEVVAGAALSNALSTFESREFVRTILGA